MKQISVIVPVYNVEEHFLKKCINSIINQTFTNLQIILVNDGSTDRSGEICEYFVKQDVRIILKNKKNGGLSSARNAGLDLATGDYIIFIDCDDYIDHDMISNLYTNAINFDAEIVQCGHIKVDEGYNILDNTLLTNDICIVKKEEAFEKFITGSLLSTVMWDKIYKKEIFKTLRFPDHYQEDAFILSNIYSSLHSKIIIDKSKYYYYVQRKNSKFHQNYDLNFMISSFTSYQNRMKISLLMNNLKLFKISSNQLGSDLLQYYNLIDNNRVIGDKKLFYKEIKFWYKNNREFMTLNRIKIKLMILYVFPSINLFFLKINKFKSKSRF